MRQLIVAAATLLAACNQVTPVDPPKDQYAEAMYQSLVKGGWEPAKARAHVNAAVADRDRLSGTFDGSIAKREKEVGSVRTSACKSDPNLSYC